MNDKKVPSQKSKDDSKIEIPQEKSSTDESEIIGLRFSNEDGERAVPEWMDILNNLPPDKAKLYKAEMEELNKKLNKSIKENFNQL